MSLLKKRFVLAACGIVFGFLLGWGCSGQVGFDNLNGTTAVNIEVSSLATSAGSKIDTPAAKDASGAATAQTEGGLGSPADLVDVVCDMAVDINSIDINGQITIEVQPLNTACVNNNACLHWSVTKELNPLDPGVSVWESPTKCTLVISGTVPSGYDYSSAVIPADMVFYHRIATNMAAGNMANALLKMQAAVQNFPSSVLAMPADVAGIQAQISLVGATNATDLGITKDADAADLASGAAYWLKVLQLSHQDSTPVADLAAAMLLTGLDGNDPVTAILGQGDMGTGVVKLVQHIDLPMAGLGGQGGSAALAYGPYMSCMDLFDDKAQSVPQICDPSAVLNQTTSFFGAIDPMTGNLLNLGPPITESMFGAQFNQPMNISSVYTATKMKEKDDPSKSVAIEIQSIDDTQYAINITDFYNHQHKDVDLIVNGAYTANNEPVGNIVSTISLGGALSNHFKDLAEKDDFTFDESATIVNWASLEALGGGVNVANDGYLGYNSAAATAQSMSIRKDVMAPEAGNWSIETSLVDISGFEKDKAEAPAQPEYAILGYGANGVGYYTGVMAMDTMDPDVEFTACVAFTRDMVGDPAELKITSGGYVDCSAATDVNFKISYTRSGRDLIAVPVAEIYIDGSLIAAELTKLDSGFDSAALANVMFPQGTVRVGLFFNNLDSSIVPSSVKVEDIIFKGIESETLQWDPAPSSGVGVRPIGGGGGPVG